MRLFFVATQFLTRLPTPRFADFQSDWLPQSARYFPLVGVLVGAINVGVWWPAHRWLPASVAVGLMLGVSMLVTGAFHEDGLADTCDGMGAGGTKERILAVMKDSRIGAFGGIGLFLALGLKWATLAALPAGLFPLLVLSAHMVSRWCAITLIWRLPYVRDEDGTSKPFADRLSATGWLLSGTIGCAALVPAAWISVQLQGTFDPAALGTAVFCSAAVTALAAYYFLRRIGGYTGDCLGAVQQLAEIAFLIGALAAVGAQPSHGA